jgi:flagellar biosynthesis/type III secretory pathway protein FliH
MPRPAVEHHVLSPRGGFQPSAFLRRAAESPFVPLTPGRTAFTAGLPIRTAPAANVSEERTATRDDAPSAPAVTSAPKAAPAPVPVGEREALLAARVAELEAALAAQAARHEEDSRIAAAEQHAATQNALQNEQRARGNSERLGSLIADVGRLRDRLVAEVRAEAADLLLVGARRLAGRALRSDPGVLEALVGECVDALGGTVLVVRVNPDDVERVQAAVGDSVRVVPDASVVAGCLAEGEGTRVDASLGTTVGTLAAELAAWRRSE